MMASIAWRNCQSVILGFPTFDRLPSRKRRTHYRESSQVVPLAAWQLRPAIATPGTNHPFLPFRHHDTILADSNDNPILLTTPPTSPLRAHLAPYATCCDETLYHRRIDLYNPHRRCRPHCQAQRTTFGHLDRRLTSTAFYPPLLPASLSELRRTGSDNGQNPLR